MRPMLRALLVLVLGAAGALGATSTAQVPDQLAPQTQPPPAPQPPPAVIHVPSAPAAHRAPAPAHPQAHPAAPPPTTGTAAPTGGPLAPGTPIPPAELGAFVDGVVREAMTTNHIAGVAVAVVQDGQVVLKRGYGFAAPGRPVDADATLFRIGSISKTFTWIALMKEVEAGRVRLASPINLYLPEPLQIRDQGFSQPILVRDLMSHSAGFEDHVLGALFEKNPDRIRPLADFLREERPRRVRPPAQISVYSNYGAMLAGEATSYVNGRPFQDLIESEITGPLAMNHTTFREPYPARADLPRPMPAALAANVSTGYRWANGGYLPQGFEYVTQGAPAGAASATAGDMARYMLMILNGGQLEGATIYGPATAQGFRTTMFANAPGVNGWDDGFMEFALPGGYRGQGHGGDTLWFHSEMVTVPALKLGVFVTTNTDTGPVLVSSLPNEIVEHFYARPPVSPTPGTPALTDDRRIYAGTYLNDRRSYHGLEKFVLMLIGQTKVSVTDDGRLLTSGDGGVQAWAPDGDPGHFRSVDGLETTAFELKDGRAVRWFPPSGATAADRVGVIYHTTTLAVMAVLAALAAVATLVGLAVRDHREARETPTQARASLVQTTVSVLWLLAMASAGVFAAGASDIGRVVYGWPGPWVVIGSSCALVAALLTVLLLALTPVVWRGGRRLDSWSIWRKARFTLTTVIFAAFGAQLLLWGALAPWSG